MYSLLLATFLYAGPDEAPEVASNQIKVQNEAVVTTVADLRKGDGGGWISPRAIIIDTEGYCWIRLDAEVFGGEKAIVTGVRVERTDKGLGVTVAEGLRWKTVDRSTIRSADVAPCMSWARYKLQTDEEPAPPKAKTKKGGAE